MSTKTRHSDVAVVIPVFNEQSVLADVLKEIQELFPLVICVDDGSSDSSGSTAHALGAEVLRHAVNLGQGASLLTGITWALRDPKIQIIVTLDADGQHDPRDAAAAVRLLREENLDIVLGSRFMVNGSSVPRLRRTLLQGAAVYTRVTTRQAFTDTHNGLRAMTRDAATRLELIHQGMAHASEIQRSIAKHSLKWAESPTDIRYTPYSLAKGQTMWNSVNILFDLVWR